MKEIRLEAGETVKFFVGGFEVDAIVRAIEIEPNPSPEYFGPPGTLPSLHPEFVGIRHFGDIVVTLEPIIRMGLDGDMHATDDTPAIVRREE